MTGLGKFGLKAASEVGGFGDKNWESMRRNWARFHFFPEKPPYFGAGFGNRFFESPSPAKQCLQLTSQHSMSPLLQRSSFERCWYTHVLNVGYCNGYCKFFQLLNAYLVREAVHTLCQPFSGLLDPPLPPSPAFFYPLVSPYPLPPSSGSCNMWTVPYGEASTNQLVIFQIASWIKITMTLEKLKQSVAGTTHSIESESEFTHRLGTIEASLGPKSPREAGRG